MRRETVLAGLAGVVVVATVLFVAFVPGAIDAPERDEGPERPGQLSIREVNIASGSVSGASASLQVDTRISHRGPAVENATLEVRAVSLESGMVEDTRRIEVESITEGGETRVTTELSVPRSGGYRIETILFRDGRRVERGSTEVRGVGSLTPAYADSPIRFHEFTGPGTMDLPTIEYSVADVSDDQVTLELRTLLTNVGDGPTDDMRVVFKVRQSDSNIVTDETTTRIGAVRPGETTALTGRVTVPDGYNYFVEAQVWRGDTLLTTARSAANLDPDPNESVSIEDDPDEDGGLRVGDFESDPEDDAAAPPERQTTASAADGGAGPGFGVGAAVAAVIAIAFIVRRYHD